jgi:2-polyprenyl-3-methyl-5-hydroxy-6-metoxy-1,4-benzoquinol methylase
MSQYKLFRSCPICNSDKTNFVKKIDFMLFPKHPMAGGYNVVQCKECGFVYADTKVTQYDLDIYYKDLSKYEDKNIGTGGGFTQYDKDRLVKTAKFISERIEDKSIRIADIGCANGGLLKELKNCGFTNLVAIDPSLACIEITKLEVGCEAYQYSIFDIGAEVGKFDLIILSHVLEHILEIGSTMKKLDELLTYSGCVYVECPNAQNYSKVIHAPYQEFNTEHINHFNEISFSNLFGINNYNKIYTDNKTMKIASDDDYHAVYGLFKKNKQLEYKLIFDDTILKFINEYIQKSAFIYDAIISELEKLTETKTIALFGIGQFAFKLLADPVLKHRKTLLLFDNNNLNVGKSINDFTIYKGADIAQILSKNNAVIVITSLIHEQNIKEGLLKIFENANISFPEIIGFKRLLNDYSIN